MAACSIPGCDKASKSAGLCGAHYERNRRAGLITARSDRSTCSVGDCGRMAAGFGLCDLHYRRQRRSGSTSPRSLPTPEERFWTFVARGAEEECWTWTGGRWPSGYGGIRVGGAKVPAHRFSYELHVGPIPEGLVVDHLCRNRACVNPGHLEPVTFRENVLRGHGMGAIHARKTHCLRGHSFEPPNGYLTKLGNRMCHACDAIRYRARRERQRS